MAQTNSSPDPITMLPAQLIFSHWYLTEQYCNLMEAGYEEASLGEHADDTRILAIGQDLNIVDKQLKENELFLRLAGLSDMEIYQ